MTLGWPWLIFRLLNGKSSVFLAHLYACTGRAIALRLALAAVAWTKRLRFTWKFLCDGQGAVRPAILYADRSCSVVTLQSGNAVHFSPMNLRGQGHVTAMTKGHLGWIFPCAFSQKLIG